MQPCRCCRRQPGLKVMNASQQASGRAAKREDDFIKAAASCHVCIAKAVARAVQLQSRRHSALSHLSISPFVPTHLLLCC